MQTFANPSHTPNLGVGDLFRRGWETFKANIGMSILMFLLYTVLTNLGSGGFGRDGGGFSMILNLAGILITGPVMAGTYYAFLRMARGEQVSFGMMFEGFQVFVKAFGVFWLMAIAILVGLVLLIVPGVILALGLIPVMFLVLDENLGVVDTLKRAWAMTDGHKGSLFLLILALIGLNILGLLALVIGVIVTATLSLHIIAAAYDELSGKSAAAAPVAPEVPEAKPIG